MDSARKLIDEIQRNGIRSAGSRVMTSISYKIKYNTVNFPVIINQKYNRFTKNDFFHKGENIFDKDWDNLIILDSFRYDYFNQLCDLEGKIEKKYSLGSSTPQFGHHNLKNIDMKDTVYISGNGTIYNLKDEIDFNFFKFIYINGGNSFGDKFLDAKIVSKYAREYSERYKNKRMVLHYVQPHSPYFTESGEELMEDVGLWRFPNRMLGHSHQDIIYAYEQNCKYILNEIKKIVKYLSGKTVITSDHGHLLGEKLSPIPIRAYSHHVDLFEDELLEIPWFECRFSDRKETTSEKVDNEQMFEVLEV